MPENKRNNVKTQSPTSGRKAPKRQRAAGPRGQRKKIENLVAFYPTRTEAQEALAELERAGFPKSRISVRRIANNDDLQDLFGTAARIAGGALAIGSMVVAAPIIFALKTLGLKAPVPEVKAPIRIGVNVDREPDAKRAEEALLRTGSRTAGLAGQHESELMSREYRDEKGQSHHHTRTFMREHANELRRSAA